MSLRTLHVGVGGRGTWPLEVIRHDSRFLTVGLVDLKAPNLAAARQILGKPELPCFADLPEALTSVEADAVVLCTPTRTHAALSRQAFARGKHVLVEKGMTLEFAEARDLVNEADRAGVCFCVAQNYRFSPIELTITQALQDPQHPFYPGPVEIVDYVHHRYRPEPRTLDYPFAMVWDMGCHHVDSLSCWLGEARSVLARSYKTAWTAYPHDANISAIIEYESGAVCHYVLTHDATVSERRLLLQGPRGGLRAFDVPGVCFYPRPSKQLGSSESISVPLLDSPSAEAGVMEAFYRFIREGIEPGISGRNNLKTLAVCEMLCRSAQEGRKMRRSEL